jgi:tripartite-type tricarboxylate transporter receptor subunit TctC
MLESPSRRALLRAGIITTVAAPFVARAAQAWPTKPVRIICAFPAGGITDAYARVYGEYISQKSGQTVVVENRAGAGGGLGAQALLSAPDDGHTLMITISSTMLGNRVMYKSLPYNPDKDFAFLAMMSTGHLPLVVQKSTGVKNLAEFVDYARKNRVSFGSYAAGSFAHIAGFELNRRFNLDMTIVHYRGEAPMWQDLLTGSSQAAVGSYTASKGVLDAGAGVAIAVPTTKRMKTLPDVPTFAEQGLTDKVFDLMSWAGFFGKASMSPDMVEAISGLMVEAGKTERIQRLIATFGIDEAAQDHRAFRTIYETEGPIWLDNLAKLGITPN